MPARDMDSKTVHTDQKRIGMDGKMIGMGPKKIDVPVFYSAAQLGFRYAKNVHLNIYNALL